jgi:hypothetical protein
MSLAYNPSIIPSANVSNSLFTSIEHRYLYIYKENPVRQSFYKRNLFFW